MQNKSRTYALALRFALENASEKKQAERAKTFKKLLKKRGDLKLASKILHDFLTLWKERKGKIAQVQSAQPLRSGVRAHSKRAVEKKGFVFEEKINPALLGGIAVFFGNEYCIDNTLKGKMRRLREQLKIIES